MLTYFQAIILGLVQGVTELFPISSLGHSVILPGIFGWNIDQNGTYFLIFLVGTHLATSLVLFAFFFKDWMLIIKGIFTSLKNRAISEDNVYEKLAWLLVIGSIPAGIIGLLFEQKLKMLFATPQYVSGFLLLNGILLFGAEALRKRKIAAAQGIAEVSGDARISKLSWSQSVKIGCAQALALIPGFSRTGATLGGGLLVGLDHEAAARFSFLLATPIIFAAAVLELPELLVSPSYNTGPLFAGALAAALAAYFSVKFLLRYFRTKTLTPFAIYCVIAGACAFLFYLVR